LSTDIPTLLVNTGNQLSFQQLVHVYILSSGIIRMAYGEVTVHRTTYEDGAA